MLLEKKRGGFNGEVEGQRLGAKDRYDIRQRISKRIWQFERRNLLLHGKGYSNEQSSYQEYLKLKARHEALQRTHRQVHCTVKWFILTNFMGEDLGPLSGRDLESLERQLDVSLKQIRSIRTQCMLDQLTDLQRKEQMLSESNKTLARKLEEGSQGNALQWDPNAQGLGYGRQPAHPQGDGFFHPLECEPTLQIGYQHDQVAVMAPGPSGSSYMAGWLA
ncbi:hypothetical protein HHK36_015856 [Tetracentron sinense]|uniref:K-box domain-containing protein n=1 Tax=Tetracentron sinense TaxID=13715 RepID=A0A834Z7X8_TETSI|nr:hypothetical protein HHK36_015856 [Tetracentron sinense]